MSFHEDDTQILPVLEDSEIHRATVPGDKTNPQQMPKGSGKLVDTNWMAQIDYAELEARAMAMFTPPFAAHPAIVIHDDVTYLPEEREGCTWVVRDSKGMPYHAAHGTSREFAEKLATEMTELFSSTDLSK